MKIAYLLGKSFLIFITITAFAIFILVACSSSDEALVTQTELNSAQIETKKEIEELKSKIEELASNADTLSTEFTSSADALGAGVGGIKSDVGQLDSKIEELASNAEVLSTDVDRLGADVGRLDSDVEEINARENFLRKAFELMPELSRNVATITLIPILNGREPGKPNSEGVFQEPIGVPKGNGVMWDKQRLVTPGHVARAMSQIIEAPPPPVEGFPKFSAIAHFPFLQEEDSSSSVIIVLGKPHISEDGLVAVYCIEPENGPIYNRLSPTLTFFTPATKEEIEVGETLFRISLSPQKASLGGAFETKRVEAVSAEGSYVERLATDMPDYVKESLAKYMVVSGGTPGDSGGPMLMANENYDGFLLAGITEGGSIAIRADVISDFLETVSCAGQED